MVWSRPLTQIEPRNHGTNEDGLVELLQSFPWAAGLAYLIEAVGAPSLVQQEYDSPFIGSCSAPSFKATCENFGIAL